MRSKSILIAMLFVIVVVVVEWTILRAFPTLLLIPSQPVAAQLRDTPVVSSPSPAGVSSTQDVNNQPEGLNNDSEDESESRVEDGNAVITSTSRSDDHFQHGKLSLDDFATWAFSPPPVAGDEFLRRLVDCACAHVSADKALSNRHAELGNKIKDPVAEAMRTAFPFREPDQRSPLQQFADEEVAKVFSPYLERDAEEAGRRLIQDAQCFLAIYYFNNGTHCFLCMQDPTLRVDNYQARAWLQTMEDCNEQLGKVYDRSMPDSEAYFRITKAEVEAVYTRNLNSLLPRVAE